MKEPALSIICNLEPVFLKLLKSLSTKDIANLAKSSLISTIRDKMWRFLLWESMYKIYGKQVSKNSISCYHALHKIERYEIKIKESYRHIRSLKDELRKERHELECERFELVLTKIELRKKIDEFRDKLKDEFRHEYRCELKEERDELKEERDALEYERDALENERDTLKYEKDEFRGIMECCRYCRDAVY